ncbi:hypothetical protein [Candidatus Parabeggiatoa sp. HSG14]|nr:hypothetical protein [Thiotrichales bacterium HSG14]
MLNNPLTNLQMEILELYSMELPVEELNELKIILIVTDFGDTP